MWSYLMQVRMQFDMLSLRHISPSLVTLAHLWEILLRIHPELSHQIWLPDDPIFKQWHYHGSHCADNDIYWC